MGSVDYPAQEAQRRMLEILHEKLQQAYENGKYSALITRQQVAAMGAEIGISPTEAAQLFSRLAEERYFHATGLKSYSDAETGAPVPFEWGRVHHLSERGLMEIGELPDPGEKLINAFEAAIETIERSDMPESQKRVLLDQARLVIDALRAAEGLADLAGRMFGG